MIKRWALTGALFAALAVAPGVASAGSGSLLNLDLTPVMVGATETVYDQIDALTGWSIPHDYEYVNLLGVKLAIDPVYFFTD